MKKHFEIKSITQPFLVLVLSWSSFVFGAPADANSDALSALKPSDLIAQLSVKFPASSTQHEVTSTQYSIVQRYLDQYVQAIGTNLSVQNIEAILNETKQNEYLQANVFCWFYQSGILMKFNENERLVGYGILELQVSLSQGEAFRAGVGLLRRLIKPEGANVVKSGKDVQLAEGAILKMVSEHLTQGVHSEKDEFVSRSVLEDVRKLRKNDRLAKSAYIDLLHACITNDSLRSSIRIRTATLMTQDSTNKSQVIHLLQSQIDSSRNDEATKNEFRSLLEKTK